MGGAQGAVRVAEGNAPSGEGTPRHDVHTLIGNSPAVAVQVFKSPTCIAEARPYWADL